MRIFVVGNINAGKSYVANKLKQLFPTYHILAIDTYRKSLSDGTLSKELMVRKQFAQDILKYPDAIIEFSGGTTITDYFIDDIEKNSFIIIEVQAPLKLCLQRIKDKRFSETPYPKFNETIEETIIRLHELFNEGLINQSFKHKFLHKFVISSQDDITKLPLYQYQNALAIRKLFKGHCEALISYGSLGRHDLNRLSDIDLFLLTNDSVSLVYDTLKNRFKDARFIIQKNQIVIMYNEELIELAVVHKLDEIKVYYTSGGILNIDKTVLLGDTHIYQALTQFINDHSFDFIKAFDDTLSRLKYYTYTLNRIIDKKDMYKYFFHVNIIIHEFLKIKYFIKGQTLFSYLPRYGLNYLDLDIFDNLIFNIHEDPQAHYQRLKAIVETLLESANTYRKSL